MSAFFCAVLGGWEYVDDELTHSAAKARQRGLRLPPQTAGGIVRIKLRKVSAIERRRLKATGEWSLGNSKMLVFGVGDMHTGQHIVKSMQECNAPRLAAEAARVRRVERAASQLFMRFLEDSVAASTSSSKAQPHEA